MFYKRTDGADDEPKQLLTVKSILRHERVVAGSAEPWAIAPATDVPLDSSDNQTARELFESYLGVVSAARNEDRLDNFDVTQDLTPFARKVQTAEQLDELKQVIN